MKKGISWLLAVVVVVTTILGNTLFFPTEVSAAISEDGDAIYCIYNVATGHSMDVPDGKDENFLLIRGFAKNDARAQKFKLKTAGNGYYYIVPQCATSRAFDINNGSSADGVQCQLYSQNHLGPQRFRFEDVGNGRYRIINQTSGKALRENDDGAICQYTPADDTRQYWILKKVVDKHTFTNPVNCNGADPWVIQAGGNYYLCRSGGNGVYLDKASNLWELNNSAQTKKIFTIPGNDGATGGVWAPEIMYLRGRWYIYYAPETNYTGITGNDSHRMYVAEGGTNPNDPWDGEYVSKGRLQAYDSDKWAIDGTAFEYNGQLYFVWSGWEGDSNGEQVIYISTMSNPYTLSSNRVMIARPDKSWETQYSPTVTEGPEILMKDGKIYIVYSASGSWTDDYCLGLLTCSDGNVMNPSSWVKSEQPVFKKTDSVFGVGHCSFVKSEDGTQDWMVYHAAKSSGSGWSREVRMQRFVWRYGTPYFGEPISANVSIGKPSQNNETYVSTDKYYKLRNIATGRCLDIPNGSSENSAILQTWTENTADAQKFKFIQSDETGWYYIEPKCAPGKAIDNPVGRTDKNTTYQTWTQNGNDAQKMMLERIGENKYRLINKTSLLALADMSASGGVVQQQVLSNDDNQMWELVEVEDAAIQKMSINVNENNVLPLGKTFKKDGYITFSYANSGVEINFTGTSLSASLIGNVYNNNANDTQPIAVFIDDKIQPRDATFIKVLPGENEYVLASNLPAGEHKVTIRRLARGYSAELFARNISIKSVQIDSNAQLLPKDTKKKMSIEIYGDSITNGDALLLSDNGSWSAYSWETYAGTIARHFDADIKSRGDSGNGLLKSVIKDANGNYYNVVWPTHSWSVIDDCVPEANIPYDHNANPADVVIINLGTNDNAAVNAGQLTTEEFRVEYLRFINEIHADCPNAIVIGTLGAMGASGLFQPIKDAINEANRQAGNEYAFFVELPSVSTITGGKSYDNAHPSAGAHRMYGEIVSKAIEDAMEAKGMTVSTRNLSYGAGVAVSSTLNSTYAAQYANDCNEGTKWSSIRNDDEWIQLDIGSVQTINKVLLSWECHATEYDIQVSLDGNSWNTVKQIRDGDGGLDDLSIEPTDARYVRMKGISRGTEWGYSLFEFNVYGGEMPDNTITVNKNVQLLGHQISSTVEGMRTVYSTESNIDGQEVVEAGLVYSLSDYASENELYVGSANKYVASYKATAAGICDINYSNSATATCYVMTMKFGKKNSAEYTASWRVRAYVKLKNGEYLYSDASSYTIFDIADYLYSNNIMQKYSGHTYLYDNILSVVDKNYNSIEYNWENSVAKE